MQITIDTGRLCTVDGTPSGTWGGMSFKRLVKLLQAAGELSPTETITHLRIDADRGWIDYRVDARA